MERRIEHTNVKVVKTDGTTVKENRLLVREHPFTIIVNNKSVFHLICTRDHLKELAAGRLYTEGSIQTKEDIREIKLSGDGEKAIISLQCDSTEKRSKVLVSGTDSGPDPACPTGSQSAAGPTWRPEWIFMLANAFQKDSFVHLETQGSHSCFLAKGDRILFSCEDIGRHNSIDKAIGYALLHDIDLTECILYSSGRISVDMAKKVIAAGIPVLATKAVPTAESVKLAEKCGLTLICRAYPDQFEIYSEEVQSSSE